MNSPPPVGCYNADETQGPQKTTSKLRTLVETVLSSNLGLETHILKEVLCQSLKGKDDFVH